MAIREPALCAMVVSGPVGVSCVIKASRSSTKYAKLGFCTRGGWTGELPLPDQSYASRAAVGNADMRDPYIGYQV